MAEKKISYQEEKDGLLEQYIQENPVFYRINYPEYVLILTGEHIPESSVQTE